MFFYPRSSFNRFTVTDRIDRDPWKNVGYWETTTTTSYPDDSQLIMRDTLEDGSEILAISSEGRRADEVDVQVEGKKVVILRKCSRLHVPEEFDLGDSCKGKKMVEDKTILNYDISVDKDLSQAVVKDGVIWVKVVFATESKKGTSILR